jgi:hypothetical protein
MDNHMKDSKKNSHLPVWLLVTGICTHKNKKGGLFTPWRDFLIDYMEILILNLGATIFARD